MSPTFNTCFSYLGLSCLWAGNSSYSVIIYILNRTFPIYLDFSVIILGTTLKLIGMK